MRQALVVVRQVLRQQRQQELGQARIFENLIQNVPARESAKNLRKFACLSGREQDFPERP